MPEAVPVQLRIGTSLAIMTPTHIRSYLTHRASGAVLTDAGTLGYLLAGLPHQAQLPSLSVGFVSLLGFALRAPVASVTASYGTESPTRFHGVRSKSPSGCSCSPPRCAFS